MRALILVALLLTTQLAMAAEENDPTPELVYVTFAHYALELNKEQTVRLDATNFYGGVTSAYAEIHPPDGAPFRVMLRLVKGDEKYGTWEGTFSNVHPGKHILVAVELGDGYERPHRIPVEDQAFWVEAQPGRVVLDVVYVTMEPFNVDADEEVTITLDARDDIGIEQIVADISAPDGTIRLPLSLIDGDGKYGTWQGSFSPTERDRTYTLHALELTNVRTTERYPVEGRSVYVQAAAYVAPGGTERPIVDVVAEGWEARIHEPLLPTIAAMALMLLLLLLLLVPHSIIRRKR